MVAGWLTDGGDGPSLTYRSEYLDGPQATPLSLSLPLAEDAHSGEALGRWLSHLLPSRRGVREQLASECASGDARPVALIGALGADAPGGFSWLPERALRLARRGPSREVLALAAMRQLAAALPRDPLGASHPWQRLTLGGRQPKTALLRESGSYGRVLHATASSHILKLPVDVEGVELSDAALNECFCLLLADALGLAVVDPEVLGFDAGAALLTPRFDRVVDEGLPGVQRRHVESLAQALGAGPAGEPVTLAAALSLLGAGGGGRDDQRMLLRAVVIASLLCLPGLDASNCPLALAADGRYRLLPCHGLRSLAPSFALLGSGDYLPRLGFVIDDRRVALDVIDATLLERVAREAGLEAGSGRALVREVAERAPQLLQRVRRELLGSHRHPAIEAIITHALARAESLAASLGH
nr:HipA domain-containing protein [Natronocella acetinitrilica]